MQRRVLPLRCDLEPQDRASTELHTSVADRQRFFLGLATPRSDNLRPPSATQENLAPFRWRSQVGLRDQDPTSGMKLTTVLAAVTSA